MKKLLFASALALVFVSCKKNKNEDLAPTVTMQTLAGTYALGTVTIKTGTSPEQDFTSSFYDDCEKDDRLTLNSNGTYGYADAGVQCTPSGDDSGSWSLSVDNKKIIIDGEELAIQSYANRILKLADTDTTSGTAVTYTITLNKQ